MTWDEVAEKEFRDAIRSKWLWGATIVFGIVFGLPAVGLLILDVGLLGGQPLSGTTTRYVELMRGVLGTVVPIVAILIAYASVTGERESGSLKVLLSFPHARRDIIVGKAVGRSAVVAVPIVIALAAATIVLLLTSLSMDPRSLAAFGAATILLGVAFTSIAVAISAIVATSRRAIVGSVGVYVLSTVFWDFLSGTLIDQLFQRSELAGETALKLQVQLGLKIANPTQAYNALVSGAAGNTPAAYSLFRGLLGGLFGNPKRQQAIELLGDPAPIVFQPPSIAIALLLWAVVPVAVGALLFERTDL